MKINTLLSMFAPKDVKFFPMLEETASILSQSSTYLQELFSCADEAHRTELCRLIKAEEVKGDKVTGSIIHELNNTFITPFDREDVHALADVMDDVIDVINRCAQKVLLYQPHSFPKHAISLVEIIKKGSNEIQNAANELSNMKKTDLRLRAHCKEIKRLEEEADVVYEEAIMSLFKGAAATNDTIELIKLKEIIQELEKAANKINSTGKVITTILVKYA
jgi:predicted phosphate transport protein (TIGR00153 family)